MPNESSELQPSVHQHFSCNKLTPITVDSLTEPLISNTTESEVKCPPAKPKRQFAYFNLKSDTILADSDCGYIDEGDELLNKETSSINGKYPDRGLNPIASQKGNFFHRNLHLFLPFRAKNPDKMNSDFNMKDLQTAPPIPQQRYRYRLDGIDTSPNGLPSGFSTGSSSTRMMSPVLEESEHNHDDNDCGGSRRRFNAKPASDISDNEHIYGRVRRIAPSMNEDDEEDHRIDYNAFGASYGDSDMPPLSFANFNKKYSMGGVNGRIQDVAPQRQQPPRQVVGGVEDGNATSRKPVRASTSAARRCCSRLLGLEAGVLLIAVLELIFIVYQTVSASLAYDKTGDENAFAFTLTLFSFVLAIIAVILLLVGVNRRSPYFLVPHLLMQFAVFSMALALSVYFTLLLIGGTYVTVDSIFYEDSTIGENGLSKANAFQSIKINILAHGLNTIIISLLACLLIFFFLQIWFFAVVRRCYKLFYHLSIEKQSSAVTMTSGGIEAPGKLSNVSTATPNSLITVTDASPATRHHYSYQDSN